MMAAAGYDINNQIIARLFTIPSSLEKEVAEVLQNQSGVS